MKIAEHKHSPEPWTLGKDTCEIFSQISDYIAATECIHVSGREATANALRIVLCVNAAAGVSNEELEKFALDDIKNPYVHDLEQQIEFLEMEIKHLTSDKEAPDA